MMILSFVAKTTEITERSFIQIKKVVGCPSFGE
jgi:hypothetical protein